MRHSTYLGNENNNEAKLKQQTINIKQQGSPTSKQGDNGGKVFETTTGHAVLPTNIPVISPMALNSLPPNIKAIPLGISADTGLPVLSAAVNNGTPVSTEKKSVNKKEDAVYPSGVGVVSGNPAVSIPMELLNQIMNGEITFHSLSSKSKDLSSSSLVGIDTEMGTIPVIPVKGCLLYTSPSPRDS